MNKSYRLYFYFAAIIFLFGLGFSFFQNRLVNEQVYFATIHNKEEAFQTDQFWAFRTADKIWGWELTVPQEDTSKLVKTVQKVQSDTQIMAYITLLFLSSPFVLTVTGLLKKRRLSYIKKT